MFRLINQWAQKLGESSSSELSTIDGESLIKLKSLMIDALFSWVLLDIKREQFMIIGKECQEIIAILFEELANERDNYSTASSCIGELLIICKKMEDHKLASFLKQNLLLLVDKCKSLCEEENVEAVETYACKYYSD